MGAMLRHGRCAKGAAPRACMGAAQWATRQGRCTTGAARRALRVTEDGRLVKVVNVSMWAITACDKKTIWQKSAETWPEFDFGAEK